MTIREDAVEVMNRLTKEIEDRRSMSRFVKDDPETKLYADALNTIGFLISPPEPTEELRAHKIMTSEEYRDLNLKGWHMVCKDYDGPHSVGVRYTGDQTGSMPLQDHAVPQDERAT